ncbi:MAG: citryl-CoA lyase [Chloroflexi bacterium]|nr:citryl-CoA lyase [Chloroflexota bacterium]
MGPWRTAITHSDRDHVWVRGYDVTELMANITFADMVVLLHRGELPTPAERKIIDAILVAIADHGPGSPSSMAARTIATGNRRAVEAAIAGGILAIGDAHAGAGFDCMMVITDGIARAKKESMLFVDMAEKIVAETRAANKRLPGLGHPFHDQDPRTVRLFEMVNELGLARDGYTFIHALADATRKQIKALPINADGAIAAILYDLGLPPLMAKTIFIIGRVAGLSAQVMEEYSREKPLRVRIDDVQYDGIPPRKL